MTETKSLREPGMKFYVFVWIGLMIIAGIEVLLTYQGFSTGKLLAILLILAACEAGIALMYFMHLKYERPTLFWSLIPVTIFVLFMMDHIWADAIRLVRVRVLPF
ncbi:MAG TPA: cytochrome C oxidase subunit IV family protein [Terriglobales bacterium]|nr:cytochrome C oxidase subunit IV family protein [Terriglobales bacterium]